MQLPAVSSCSLPRSRVPCPSAIGSLTQRAAELLGSHYSLGSSTDSNPSGSGRNAASTTLREQLTTCHVHALARHTFVSAPHLTTVHTRYFCGRRRNAVVILRNFLSPASSMARRANYHCFSCCTVRPQDLPCGRRILDSSVADDLWVKPQHMRLPVVYFRDLLCAGRTADAFCQV